MTVDPEKSHEHRQPIRTSTRPRTSSGTPAAVSAALALAHLMGAESLLADTATGKSLRPRPEYNGGLHHLAKARRVVHLFMSGAASQCDTFDYKPALIKKNGQKFDPGGKVELFQSEPGAVMASPWKWRQHGQCGRWVSDLVPHLAGCVDDMAFLPAMVAKSNVHGPATFMQNTGFVLPGFPEHGGLDLVRPGKPEPEPADVRGAARFAGVRPQRAGQLERRLPAGRAPGDDGPARRQDPDLRPVSARGSEPRRPRAQRDGLALLNRLNRDRTRPSRAGDSRLEARIASLRAGRPAATERARGARPVGRIAGDASALRPGRADHRGLRPQLPDRPAAARARRPVRAGLERRRQRLPAAQLGLARRHRPRPRRRWPPSMDQPAAALIQDLKSRGLLDDTIVIWTTEFGRMPCSQGAQGPRPQPVHLHLLAGRRRHQGGRRPTAPATNGRTRPSRTPPTATTCTPPSLHLLGIDHTRLTFRHNGIDRRLTDVHGHVIKEILA